ncbi:MAG: hypothetical protein HRT69_09100, partial [Flavobacteriaceae bacterium]|nr:hypothetical protein [Flavobacteriaceae bacterium]
MKTFFLYALLLIYGYSYAQTFPTNNLAGYYKFNSGNVLIDQAGASNLAQTGVNLVEITDRFNTASTNAVSLNQDYLLRGDVGNVNVGNSQNLAVTHAFWIKTSNTTQGISEFIIGDSDRPNLSHGSTSYGYDIILRDSKILLNARYQSINSGNSNPAAAGYSQISNKIVADSEWHHVTIVFYTTTGLYNGLPGRIYSRMYIDGSLDSTNSFIAPSGYGRITILPFSTGDLVIGNNRNKNLTATNQYKDGFDDYFVYNRVLSAAEITTLATQEGYCFTPENNILSVVGVTENAATVNIATTGTYDIAYVKSGYTFNGIANHNNVGTSVNLTGLDASTVYNVYVREQCGAGFETDWSAPINFRTLGQIYVDDTATGLNNGSSWANAFTDLGSAMDTDVNGQEIWVAGGTYKTGNVIFSFTIDKTNISLYGGFAGTETSLSQRVLGTNESIISGDNSSNDNPNVLYQIDFNTRRDNTRRLIKLNSSSNDFTIDGFTITAAMSGPDGTSSGERGAGIYNNGADNVMVSNCKFFRNGTTGQGGAILAAPNNNGQITIESCVFEENFADSGAAIHQLASGSSNTVNISKSIFLNNKTLDHAGAIYSLHQSGGTSTLNIDACEFIGNNSRSGGAIYVAVRDTNTLNAAITNSLFNGNIAEDNATNLGYTGSAAWFKTIGASSTLTSSIVNNTFVNNIDTGTASGLTNFNRATLALSKDNAAANHNATISNNIFYFNETTNSITSKSISGLNETMATVIVENSIDEDSFSLISAGSTTNISNGNPQFVNVAGNDYTIEVINSPAINTGKSSAITTALDLSGNQRVYGTIVDMGAYEYQCTTNCFQVIVNIVGNGTVTQNSIFYGNGDIATLTPDSDPGWVFTGWSGDASGNSNPLSITMDSSKTVTATFLVTPIYVDLNATGNNDGSSWVNAYTSLTTALSSAATDDIIWVAKGVYKPHATNRDASFVLNHSIYGGFSGTEVDWLDRNLSLIHTVNETILSGDLSGDDDATVEYNDTTRDDNSKHVVEVASNNLEINGFTIQDGVANAISGDDRFGAGIFKEFSVPNLTVKNCKIKNNIAAYGAGISLIATSTSNIIIDACFIENNVAHAGAGLDYHLSGTNGTMNITITNSLFHANKTLTNSAWNWQGLGSTAARLRVYHTGVTLNVTLVNNTFVNNVNLEDRLNNSAGNYPVIALSKNEGDFGNITIANNIFWGNRTHSNQVAKAIGRSHSINTALQNTDSQRVVENNIDEDGFSTFASTPIGTITTNPLFTSTSNFTLQSNSPAIDSGNNTYTTTTMDLAGSTRVSNTTVDIGCYENIVLGINVAIDAFLQGPSLSPNTAGLMNDDLRIGSYIPTTSPYSDNLTCNTSVFTAIGNDAIVDWVFVELRD